MLMLQNCSRRKTITLSFLSVIYRGGKCVNSDIMGNTKGFCGYLSSKRKMWTHSTGAGCLAEAGSWSCFEQGPVPGELGCPVRPVQVCQSALEIRVAFAGYVQVWIYFLRHAKEHILLWWAWFFLCLKVMLDPCRDWNCLSVHLHSVAPGLCVCSTVLPGTTVCEPISGSALQDCLFLLVQKARSILHKMY